MASEAAVFSAAALALGTAAAADASADVSADAFADASADAFAESHDPPAAPALGEAFDGRSGRDVTRQRPGVDQSTCVTTRPRSTSWPCARCCGTRPK